jgi:hypothetical protein
VLTVLIIDYLVRSAIQQTFSIPITLKFVSKKSAGRSCVISVFDRERKVVQAGYGSIVLRALTHEQLKQYLNLLETT